MTRVARSARLATRSRLERSIGRSEAVITAAVKMVGTRARAITLATF